MVKSDFCLLSLHHRVTESAVILGYQQCYCLVHGHLVFFFFPMQNLLLIGFRSLPRHTGAARRDALERLAPARWRDCDFGVSRQMGMKAVSENSPFPMQTKQSHTSRFKGGIERRLSRLG